MSFILDALQKAESLRGRQPVTAPLDQALGDIAEPPAVRSSWRIGALLAGVVATVLLTLYVLNPPDSKARLPVPVADTTTRTSFSTMASDTPLIDVATPATREVRSLNREAAHTPTRQVAPGSVSISPEPLADTSAPVTPGTVSVSQEPLSATETPSRVLTNVSEENLPSYQELVLNRRVQMPEFHLDIHVYAPSPERRFVFVNNRKYREGAKLDEGGTVERITPVGAILNHRGHRFELVPD